MEDERGPGLDFSLCFVGGSRPWGAAAFLLCLFIWLLNVRRFPPPSSRIYHVRYIGAEAREEGGTRCQRALAAEWDRGAEEIGQQEVAETASGCPQRWCWSKRRTGGTEDSLPCSWDEEGWLPSERERRSRRRSPVGRSLLPSARLVEEQGTGDSLPAALDWRSHRRPPGGGRGIGPSTKEVQYHRMAPRVSRSVGWGPSGSVSGNRTEIFFFFLSPLSLLCHSSSFRLLSLASSVLTPQVRRGRPDGLPPGEGGGGGVERSLVSTPRPARGDGGMWRVGRGREPWERSEAGGVNDNERHLRHSPVSSPTEELRKE